MNSFGEGPTSDTRKTVSPFSPTMAFRLMRAPLGRHAAMAYRPACAGMDSWSRPEDSVKSTGSPLGGYTETSSGPSDGSLQTVSELMATRTPRPRRAAGQRSTLGFGPLLRC